MTLLLFCFPATFFFFAHVTCICAAGWELGHYGGSLGLLAYEHSVRQAAYQFYSSLFISIVQFVFLFALGCFQYYYFFVWFLVSFANRGFLLLINSVLCYFFVYLSFDVALIYFAESIFICIYFPLSRLVVLVPRRRWLSAFVAEGAVGGAWVL